MQNQYRLGIDAGGTFTDFILADRKGDVRIFKALSTPTRPTEAIRNGLKVIEEETGLSPETIVTNADLCINGTTVGLLNAAKNRFLVRATHGLQRAMLILGPTTLMEPARVADAHREHGAVLDALTARDGERAEARMRAHIEAAQQVRLKSLRQSAATPGPETDPGRQDAGGTHR
ncbi:hydantoinase/oxoprolinase N-terminal domain-containing protein [Paracoccus sphaerophysae]|uniref:hydantoinase/oxoprolinase N-terminal domain-containing protein n=1 Tax=Paracoccus sphaerophysae TaxID=690417 RepID=UPI00068DB060|nr:hydantoinase/oxoprolinase N-terminal domain-containing protein [Paracoccus sphaerophysae]